MPATQIPAPLPDALEALTFIHEGRVFPLHFHLGVMAGGAGGAIGTGFSGKDALAIGWDSALCKTIVDVSRAIRDGE